MATRFCTALFIAHLICITIHGMEPTSAQAQHAKQRARGHHQPQARSLKKLWQRCQTVLHKKVPDSEPAMRVQDLMAALIVLPKDERVQKWLEQKQETQEATQEAAQLLTVFDTCLIPKPLTQALRKVAECCFSADLEKYLAQHVVADETRFLQPTSTAHGDSLQERRLHMTDTGDLLHLHCVHDAQQGQVGTAIHLIDATTGKIKKEVTAPSPQEIFFVQIGMNPYAHTMEKINALYNTAPIKGFACTPLSRTHTAIHYNNTNDHGRIVIFDRTSAQVKTTLRFDHNIHTVFKSLVGNCLMSTYAMRVHLFNMKGKTIFCEPHEKPKKIQCPFISSVQLANSSIVVLKGCYAELTSHPQKMRKITWASMTGYIPTLNRAIWKTDLVSPFCPAELIAAGKDTAVLLYKDRLDFINSLSGDMHTLILKQPFNAKPRSCTFGEHFVVADNTKALLFDHDGRCKQQLTFDLTKVRYPELKAMTSNHLALALFHGHATDTSRPGVLHICRAEIPKVETLEEAYAVIDTNL
jgi:hypothetical protein